MDRIKRPWLEEFKYRVASYMFTSATHFYRDIERRECFDQGMEGILFYSKDPIVIRGKPTEAELACLDARLFDEDIYDIKEFPDIAVLEDEPLKQILTNSRGMNDPRSKLYLRCNFEHFVENMTEPKYESWELSQIYEQLISDEGIVVKPTIQLLPFQQDATYLVGTHNIENFKIIERDEKVILLGGDF